MPQPEIVKTDKRYRRNLFIAYAVLIAAGVLFWNLARPALFHYVNGLPARQFTETVETIQHFVMLLFIPAAIYLIVVGRKIWRHQALPYPGMRVIHDSIVIRGKRAVRRGKLLVGLGTLMIALAIASMIANHYIILKFKHHPLISPIFYGTNV
jgi:hypothetical protein